MFRFIKCYPPAKINLSLRILFKRVDGYHEIETLLQTVNLTDSLEISLTKNHSIELNVFKSNIPSDESNLCFKAAELFSKEVKGFCGCKIELTKTIPDGAGLGGGSSDAASTLKSLNELFDYTLSNEKLFKLASTLGSDVPFFLREGTAVGNGRGDILTYVETTWNYPVLIVCPSFKISTSWAYQNLKIALTREPNCNILLSLLSEKLSSSDILKYFSNDFESPVFLKYPNLGELKDRLYQEGAFFAGMSGSGSSLFGLFFSNNQAKKAKISFQNQYTVFIAKLIAGNK